MTANRNLADLARSAATVPTAASDPTLGANLIINGGMTVSQRGTSFTGLGTASTFTLDRWRTTLNGSNSARYTISQETTGGPYANATWMKIACTTGSSALGANDSLFIQQKLEGNVCTSLNAVGGGSNAFVVSGRIILDADAASSITFPAKMGMYFVSVGGTNRQYVSDITIDADNTWQEFSVSVASDATAQFISGTVQGGELGFTLLAGSNRVATADTWINNAADFKTSSSDDILDASSNILGLCEVKLEVGSTATAFQHEPYGDVLAKCHRYYWHINLLAGTRWLAGCYDATNALGTHLPFPVEMRAVPTSSHTSSVFRAGHNGSIHDSTITVGFTKDRWGYMPNINPFASASQGQTYWILDNGGTTVTGDVSFSAEL